MRSYAIYYLTTILLSYGMRSPWLLGLLVAFVLLRDVLPDPHALLRALLRMGTLKRRITTNPSDVPAHRDLARIYLDVRRPGAAAQLLAKARERAPKDRELAHLHGIALLATRKTEEALAALGQAAGVGPDGKLSSVDPHRRGDWGRSSTQTADIMLLAGTALERLGRLDQAEDALLAASEFNSSAIAPLVRLAALRAHRGDREGAGAALRDVRKTWSQLPGYARRHQWGWRVRGFFGGLFWA